MAGTLVWQHRVGDKLVIGCREAATGEERWRHAHPTDYVDAYGYSDGPRASPVIAGDSVFCQNADGKLYAHALADGEARWERDLVGEYRATVPFFGFSATPLAVGNLLVVPVGAPGGPSVVAFDRATGAERWRAGDRWRADCASPILRRFGGERRILCFVGGKTRPPVGGLLVLDPADGRIVARHPFRSRTYQSVNAANPCVVGKRIILTSAYHTGDLALDLVDGELHEAWWQDDLNSHWCTPVAVGDTVYAAGGRHRRGSALIAIDPADGLPRWRKTIAWEEDGRTRHLGRSQLVAVDGGFLALSEDGVLVRLAADRDGCRLVDRARLFDAPRSWVAPILHRGRCYVAQVEPDRRSGEGPRWLCYQLHE